MLPLKDSLPAGRRPLATLALLAAAVAAALVLGVSGGVVALAATLLALWIFGGAVEDALGRPALLAIALAGAAAAAAVDPAAAAIGATAAVIAAYLLLRPRGTVITLVVVPAFFTIVELPALLLVAVWLGTLGGAA